MHFVLIHVIAISESWLGPDVEDSLVSLEGYRLLRCDRNTHGGGVALYVHESLSLKRLCSTSTVWTGRPGHPEFLFCEMTPKGGNPVFVGVVYRPPHSPFVAGTDFIPKLHEFLHDYGTKILLGDFNADQLSQSEDAVFLRNLMEENSLVSVPFGATHHTRTSDTWLDLCLVDALDTVIGHWKTEAPFIAGHDLITATIDLRTSKPVTQDFTYRDFKSIDVTLLNEYLANCDWSCFMDDGCSLQEGLDCLYSNLHTALNAFAPVKTVKYKKRSHPWFTSCHRHLIKERDRLYRRYKRSRLDIELYEYRQARDYAHEQIESARLEYYWHRLRSLTDPQQIWKELRHLGIVTHTRSSLANFSEEDLNAHFASISFDPAVAPDLSRLLDNLDEVRPGYRFEFTGVTLNEISKTVNNSTSQAVGVDSIPQGFIKSAFPTIGTYITALINKSLFSSMFPDQWKQSLVIALNKIPSPVSLSDFRPISLLCFLSKVLEKVVVNQMSAFVESKHIMDRYQSGYRAGYSTETLLLKLTDDIRLGKDRKLLTALVLFDFSKAFDSVDHTTLLTKLYSLGFTPGVLKWIASYLTGRSQAVKMENGHLTSFRPLNRGVPQGSVLGPLLFSLFINDISQGLEPGVHHLVYADDLQIYVQGHFENLQDTLAKLCKNAERIADWAVENGLQLNVSKTKAIIFGTSFFVNRLQSMGIGSVPLHNSEIPLVQSVRSLGVVLDSRLNWRDHVLHVCKRANSLMYRLLHFRRSTNFQLRKHLIMALLFPLVDYCSLVYRDISEELNLVLQRVLNTGIRYIYGIRKSAHITPYRRELGWLRTRGRRDYFAACLLYKLLRTHRPSYLTAYFAANVSQRPVRGGPPAPLIIPKFRTESLRNSFHISTAKLWNSLPSHIRTASSITIFKKLIKEFIFTAEGES